MKLVREARVESLGNHSFQLTKPVFFDGRRFLTRRVHGHIKTQTQPIAVQTQVSGVPLLGVFGEQTTWSETCRRQPLTNSIVVRQVTDDVVPQFNSGVEKELTRANRSWAELRQQFTGLLPYDNVDWRASSTRGGLTLKVGFWQPAGTHTVSRPQMRTSLRPVPLSYEDLVISLSDELVNQLIRCLPLNGLTLTDVDLQSLENVDLTDVFVNGKLPETTGFRDLNSESAVLFSLQFADEAPLRVHFRQDQVEVVFRFRVIPKAGPASGFHRLTLYIRGTDGGGGRWALQVAEVDAASENSDASDSSLIEIIRTQATAMLVDQPPVLIPRLTRLTAVTGLSDLQIHDIRCRDGVDRVSFQLAQGAVGSNTR